MADKNAGQQYIASLKFRIDEAKKQMAELSKLTSDTSKSIGNELSNKIFTVKMDTSSITKMEKDYIKTQNKIVLENQKKANKIEVIEANTNNKIKLMNAETNKTLAKEQIKTVEHAKRNASDIEKSYLMAGQNTKTVFQRIAENAKTYLTYNAFNEIKRAAEDLVDDLKKVETRMMEITRIMSDSSLVAEEYRDRIIELGYDYGRTFDETSEIVLNFARAGNSAEESIMLAEKALLALNTAELDAENATEGLISIMTQWGMNTGTAAEQAEKLELMIDKINKTADNFPLSSQDIIDALKRTSSAFDLAGASVDESIAMIVAAEAATKRGGKTIGTAINSMLQQIKTDTRLSAIEDLGIDVYTDETKQTYKSIVEIMTQMSEKMEQLKKDGKESSVEMQNLLSAFTVLRRNIGAGLLGNMTGEDSTYEQVLKTLDSAVGYSAQENVKWMDTLEAQLNQLEQTALKLKAAIWDSGLGDGLKDLIKIAEGGINVFTSMTKTFGALPTAVITANTAITMFSKNSKSLLSVFSGKDSGLSIDIGNFNKQMALLKNDSSLMEKDTKLLTTTFKNYINEVGKGSATLGNYTKYLVTTTAKTLALKAATALLQGAVIAIASIAISAIVKGIDNWIHKQEKIAEEIENTTLKINENQEKISELDAEIIKNTNTIKEIMADGVITDEQQKQIKNIEIENALLEDQKKLYEDNVRLQKEKAANDTKELAYQKQRKKTADNGEGNSRYIAYSIMGQDVPLNGSFTVAEEIQVNIEAVKTYEKMIGTLSDLKSKLDPSKDLERIKKINDKIKEYSNNAEILRKRNTELAGSLTDWINNLKEGDTESKNLAESLSWLQNQVVEMNEKVKKEQENISQLTEEQNEYNTILEASNQVYNGMIEKLSKLQDVYSLMNGAVEEYNSNGEISLETYNKLINSGYDLSEMFVNQNGVLKLNENAFKEQQRLMKEEMIQAIKTKAGIEILKIGLEETSSDTLKSRITNFFNSAKTSLASYISTVTQGTAAIDAFNTVQKGGTIADYNAKQMETARTIAANAQAQIDLLQKVGLTSGGSGGSGRSSGSRGKTVAEEIAERAKEALERYKSIVDEFIRADERWTEMQKAYNNYTINDELHVLRERARNYRKFAQEVMNETEIEYEERLKLQKEYIEAAEDLEVDYYELQKKEIEDLIGRLDDAYQERLEGQINAIESRADAELEAIDEVEEARDKQLAAEEYRERRRELLYGYEGVEYWSQRTGREAQLALAQAKKELEELDKEYQEQQRKDSVENRKQAIENRRDLEIQALEAAKEHNYDMARSLGYDYIVQMGEAYETEKQNIIDNAQRRLNEYIAATDGAFVYAKDKSHNLFDEYKTGFIDPLDQAMQNVFDMTNLNGYTVTFEVDTMQQAAQQTMATTSEDYRMQMETLAANNKDLYNQIAAKYAGQYDSGVFKDMLQQELINPGTYIDRVATNGVTGLASTTGGTISSSISNSKSSSNSVNLSKGSSLVSVNANVSNSVDVGSIAKKVVGAIASKLNIG